MVNAAFAENTDLDRDAELDISNHAFAAAVLACASAVGAEAEFTENNGVASFEYFGVCDARVCHVCVYAGRAVPCGPSAGPSGYSLIVSETFGCFCGGGEIAAEAEGEIVAVALGGGAGGEGAENYVCDALGGEDVAADYGCFVGGGEEGFGWDFDLDGF